MIFQGEIALYISRKLKYLKLQFFLKDFHLLIQTGKICTTLADMYQFIVFDTYHIMSNYSFNTCFLCELSLRTPDFFICS